MECPSSAYDIARIRASLKIEPASSCSSTEMGVLGPSCLSQQHELSYYPVIS